MNVRPRYFIKTKDDLYFAVNSYNHPDTHIMSFLRYIPDNNGDRTIDNKRYSKVDSNQAYEYIKKNHPEYLFIWNVENKKMMGVKREDIVEILNPINKLKEIINSNDNNSLFNKIRSIAKTFHIYGNIDYENMGVTGSTLLNLQNDNSDIDFIVFGLENHKKAIKLFSNIKDDKKYPLNRINEKYWMKVYKKRIKDDSLSFDEFMFYENRKNNRGMIDNTLFDILCCRNFNEIENIKCDYRPLGHVRIKCKITNNKYSYDTPSIYAVSDVEFLEGSQVNIEKILSFTHTYTGQVQNNERVIASGECEEVTDLEHDKKYYHLIIGTTRESINEYIKLEKIK